MVSPSQLNPSDTSKNVSVNEQRRPESEGNHRSSCNLCEKIMNHKSVVIHVWNVHGISGKGKDYSSPVPVDEGSSQANANLEDPHDVNMEIPLSSEATTASHVISAESPPANVQDGGSVVEGEVCLRMVGQLNFDICLGNTCLLTDLPRKEPVARI